MKKTNIDSPFYRTMGKIGDLLFANLLWLVCCLPIVTAGASTLGLFTVVNKMAAKEDYTVHTDFFKAVKRRIRPWMTALLAVFMAVNLVTSALALARYDARTSGAAPANAVDVLLDEHFDNARMERIYPNAKKVEKAG